MPMDEAEGSALERSGRQAHAAGDYIAASAAYEDAYTAYRLAGDSTSAARAARTVGWVRGWVFGEWAVHRGWVKRARRLLEQSDDERDRGWVVLDDALSGSDLETQRVQYLEAIDVARRTGDDDLECDATASLGMMLVFSGRVTEGMAHLDEALAAICSGDVTELPVVEGCLCGLLTACERTRDVRRADEWLRAAQRTMQRGNHVAVAGHCRAHYAGVLVAAGRWADAEDELIGALDLLPEGLASWQEARCRLAELRLRQGRLEEAELLLADVDHRIETVGLRAGLYLASGQHQVAAEMLNRALAATPPEHLLVPLLSLRVEAHLADGDFEAAGVATDLLCEQATSDAGGYTQGIAASARARVCAASGDEDARRYWRDALSSFESAGMPAEAAMARLGLGRAVSPDQVAVALAELGAALETFERIGARSQADEAAALLRSLGGPTRTGPKLHGELTQRENEVLNLLAVGLTNAEIGERLFISPKTVEHHVGRLLAKLGLRRRTQAAVFAARRT